MADAFVSYSHVDEKAVDRLHKHLAMLKRDGLINAWHDREILAGTKLDGAISEHLALASLFVALVSPDYLVSNYCYEREFSKALELEAEGRLRVIPIILEPCDWLSSPLSKFVALPRDGQPISEWTNPNNAYLDIVTGLRRILESSVRNAPEHSDEAAHRANQIAERAPRIRRDFDAIDRADFADRSFEIVKSYFLGSCEELNGVGSDVKARFELMSAVAFTCTIVNRALRNGGEAHITVRNAKSRGVLGDITYVFERHAEGSSANGWLRVDADDYNLFLLMDHLWNGRAPQDAKLSPEQAAERLWMQFVQRAGISYE